MNSLRHVSRAIAFLIAILVFPTVGLASDSSTLTQGGTLNLGTAASGDPSPDSTADIQGASCNCPDPTKIVMLNSAAHGYSNFNYANSTLADAQSVGYSTGDWVPSLGEAYYIRTASPVKYFKVELTGTNTVSGLPLQWEYLGSGGPAAPSSDFTFSSYDLIASFTDTSTGGTPTAWAWTFGDTTTSNLRNPQHRFNSAATYNVCLDASNSGGSGGNTCKNVGVSLRPSTTVANGNAFDFDPDATGDLLVSATGACSVPNKLTPIDGSEYSPISKNYQSVTTSDALTAHFTASPGGFCPLVSYYDAFLVLTSDGSIFRAWTAANDAGSIRIEYGLLINHERIFANGFDN